MVEYKIAVRSYKRVELFKKYTYSMLLENNIDVKNKLYIFVANEKEKENYSNQFECAGIIATELGGHKPIEYAVKYFKPNEYIIFMDDDLEYFFEYKNNPIDKNNLITHSTNLEKYIIDAYNTFNDTINIFSFSFIQNNFYIKNKPFKEFRPFLIAGSFFGVKNNPLIIIDHAHLDDIHRSCKYIKKFGGGLLYNWCGFKTKTGLNLGGLQESGCRGSLENRNEIMHKLAEDIYSIEYIKQLTKPPIFVKHTLCWELRLKPINELEKIISFDRLQWSKYFQQKPNIIKYKLDQFL